VRTSPGGAEGDPVIWNHFGDDLRDDVVGVELPTAALQEPLGIDPRDRADAEEEEAAV
jgi:hypothetical protein